MRDRAPIIALGALVAAAILTALATVGGPVRGAQEKRDDLRFNDLMTLRHQINCLRNGEAGNLPLSPEAEPGSPCDFGAALVDPISGAPYRYERLADDTFRICAEFEDPARIAARAEPQMGRMDSEGCITTTPEPWSVRR